MNFYEVLEAVAEFKEDISEYTNSLANPMGNHINQNYCQGVLIEEGCSADILSNHISGNLKANVALGGQGSGDTKIKKNLIERSKQEGIFVVEGGENMLIQTNIIQDNKVGIVLLHSDGIVDSNRIQENEMSGLSIISETVAKIENNQIENNKKYGIEIKDPGQPEMRKNRVQGNMFQVKLDTNAKRKWDQYLSNNPDIIGDNELP